MTPPDRNAIRAELLAEQAAAHVARIRAGRAAALAGGRSVGRSTPLGAHPAYPREREARELARELRAGGETLRWIAAELESAGYLSRAGTRYSVSAVTRMTRGASPEED